MPTQQRCDEPLTPTCVCVRGSQETKAVLIKTKEIKHTFSFDRVFGPDCTQADVYEYVAKPVVQVRACVGAKSAQLSTF